MNTMATANMANMNPAMGGPVGAPMPMMNNGALAPQVGGPRQAQPDSSRTLLNTYIYEYFMRYGQYDCARAILQADPNIKIKDGTGNGDGGLGGDLGDGMDTDTKDGMDTKRPADLPAPNVPTPVPDSCFLYEWFCLFWDMFNSQKGKGQSQQVNQYVQHTQQQSRMRQEQQQNMLRSLRPEFAHQAAQQQYQAQMMRGMQNGAMGMNMKQANLQRAAMANSQNPNLHMLQQQQKAAAQMQRDPSDMDGNRARPASPSGGAENAPSPSKRQRLENGPFNPNPGAMMPNGRQPQGISGQPQHHGTQMAQKPMANPGGPQTQGSPMNQQGPDGAALNQYYNPSDMASGNMRQGGPGNAQGQSNGALQDYQMQLMLLEQQNKKRLMMARQEQDMSGGMREGPAPGPPGGPAPPGGPNAQNFQGTSPPGGRAGASPNPSEQMKRANQMNNAANMGSPLPDGAQNRSSPGAINFIGNNLDPNGAPNFFKAGSDGGMNMMSAAQMNVNGMRPPPSSHPGPPFNGPMTPQQQIMAARQAQAQQQAHAQGGQGMQWSQNGPNGQMAGQGPQPQVQGTPNQRSMPPPQAPAAPANSVNSRNATSSPQTSTAAPPTPQAANKPAPKKKESKSAKSKAATQKKTNTNLNTGATPAADSEPQQETPAPATPITPVNAGNFAKNQTLPAQVVPNGQPPAPAQAPQGAPVPAQQHPDPTQTNSFMDPSMDFQMDFANPLTSGDVLNDFDFDSFLHESNGEDGPFDFNAGTFMEGNEIGAD